MGVSSRDCRILFSSHTKKRVPWRRKWQPTPVPLLGKSHGESSVQPSMEYNRAGHGLATKKQMAVLANVWEQTLVRNWGLGLKPTSYCWQMWMLFRKTKINCKQIFKLKKKGFSGILKLGYVGLRLWGWAKWKSIAIERMIEWIKDKGLYPKPGRMPLYSHPALLGCC